MKDFPLHSATNMFNQGIHLEHSSTNQPDIVRLGPQIKMLFLAVRKFTSKQMIHSESLDTIALFLTFTHQLNLPSALHDHRARNQATVDSTPYTPQSSQEVFKWILPCSLYPDLSSSRNPTTYSGFTVLCPASPTVALFHDNPPNILRMLLRRLGFLWEKGAFQAETKVRKCSLCYSGSSEEDKGKQLRLYSLKAMFIFS